MKTMLSLVLGVAMWMGCGVAMGEPAADAGRLDAGAKFILGKLEGKVLGEMNFKEATLGEASGEVGRMGGVSFVLKEEVANARKVTYAGKNVRLLEVVGEIARQCGRDAYVTSSGILLTGEGAGGGGGGGRGGEAGDQLLGTGAAGEGGAGDSAG